jgi:hypothetical protein
MIRGGRDRAKVSQTYTLKRIDYSLRMARRSSDDTLANRTSRGTRVDANDQTGPSESVATLDRAPRLEDHVTLSELGRIDEAF